MITSINEFFFSKHYLYDSDNRFNLRIKNAIILNKLEDPIKADKRLKKALYYYGLEVLDKAASKTQPMAIVFGNIYFRENKRLIPAELEVDNTVKGNVYVAIVKEQTVVTLLIMPITVSNKDIADKIYAHDGTEIKEIRDGDLNQLSFDNKKRKHIVIDLDITDSDFNNQYPTPILKNNKIKPGDGGLTILDIEDMDKAKNTKPEEQRFSLTAIPSEMKSLIPNKEFVIYAGMEILVPYPEGPKIKKIRELVVDEKGDKRQFMLIFENTLKPMPLNIGTTFIISSKMANDTYNKLIAGFGLEDGKELSFQGPITKFNFYKKGKGGSDRAKLGVIIDPRMFF